MNDSVVHAVSGAAGGCVAMYVVVILVSPSTPSRQGFKRADKLDN